LTDYKAASLSKATFKQYRETDSTPDMFVKVNKCRLKAVNFVKGREIVSRPKLVI